MKPREDAVGVELETHEEFIVIQDALIEAAGAKPTDIPFSNLVEEKLAKAALKHLDNKAKAKEAAFEAGLAWWKQKPEGVFTPEDRINVTIGNAIGERMQEMDEFRTFVMNLSDSLKRSRQLANKRAKANKG